MTITPEVKAELLEMLRQELAREEQRKKENRTAYQRACKDFQEAFAGFDYEEICTGSRTDGSVWGFNAGHKMQHKVRDAIGTLLRAVYQVDTVAKLPAEKEPQMKHFISSVLKLMNEQKDAPRFQEAEIKEDKK